MSNASNKDLHLAAAPKSLWEAARFIAGLTLISKLLGALRDWQIFHVFGASQATDAYFAAVQIPWYSLILLGGLGGPFHSAVVAVFSKLVEPGKPPSTETVRLANYVLAVVGVVFMAISLVLAFASQPVMALLLGGKSPGSAMVVLAAKHLQIMAPVVFFGGWIGVYYGLLNVYHHYLWPSLSPALMNVVMMGMLLIFPVDSQGLVLSYATVVGAFLQWLMQVVPSVKLGWRPLLTQWLKPQFWQLAQDPQVKALALLIGPMLVGTTIGQLLVMVDMLFVSHLEPGAWSAVVLSNRLLQLPIGVLQTALLVPLFPRFSAAVGRDDWQSLQLDLRRGIVPLWVVSIPMLLAIIFLGEPLIRLVFEHGAFTQRDTALVSLALTYQSLQIIPYFARDTFIRVFYAFGNSWTPLWVSLLAIAIKWGLNALLVERLGLGGITLSTALVTTINMVLLGALMAVSYREKVLPPLRELLGVLGQCVVVLAIMGLVCGSYLIGVSSVGLSGLTFLSLAERLVLLVLLLAVFFVWLWKTRLPEITLLLNKAKRAVTLD
ncbi:MAG: murein biosynthesis integral membrane protein MurJ [Vampirovibrionales bacterium]